MGTRQSGRFRTAKLRAPKPRTAARPNQRHRRCMRKEAHKPEPVQLLQATLTPHPQNAATCRQFGPDRCPGVQTRAEPAARTDATIGSLRTGADRPKLLPSVRATLAPARTDGHRRSTVPLALGSRARAVSSGHRRPGPNWRAASDRSRPCSPTHRQPCARGCLCPGEAVCAPAAVRARPMSPTHGDVGCSRWIPAREIPTVE